MQGLGVTGGEMKTLLGICLMLHVRKLMVKIDVSQFCDYKIL